MCSNSSYKLHKKIVNDDHHLSVAFKTSYSSGLKWGTNLRFYTQNYVEHWRKMLIRCFYLHLTIKSFIFSSCGEKEMKNNLTTMESATKLRNEFESYFQNFAYTVLMAYIVHSYARLHIELNCNFEENFEINRKVWVRIPYFDSQRIYLLSL